MPPDALIAPQIVDAARAAGQVDGVTRVIELAWLVAWPPMIWWRVRELERQVHVALRDLGQTRERLAALEGRESR